jgi:acid stress-induced BolA-like protein IbaG/YrbA
MALRILSSPSDPDAVARDLRRAIEEAIPGAQVEVEAAAPGHFALVVTSEAFAGKSRVAQQQLVYGAIAHLMRGDDAPVHAIDRLQTVVP